MTAYARYDSVFPKLIFLFSIIISIPASFQQLQNAQHKTSHLPETKFSNNEYFEYPENEDRQTTGDRGPQVLQWPNVPYRGMQLGQINPQVTGAPVTSPEKLDQSIRWDSKWAADLKFGQLSAVSVDPKGNIAIFHRGNRVWGAGTFDNGNNFDRSEGRVKQNTIVLLDKSGKKIGEWGSNMFYLPHGLTVDSSGNYWVTDVALHQVFKFDAKDIEDLLVGMKRKQIKTQGSNGDVRNVNDLFGNSLIKPSLILGEAFQPGNDEKRFCKPTSVAVQKNGDFFVGDGYCNSRIIKFDKSGQRILQWGRRWGPQDAQYQNPPPNAFYVPHALALAEELNYVLVADRENGRILCFNSINGSFHREYKHPAIGSRIFSIAYAKEKIYLVNGPEFGQHSAHIRGYVIDIKTGNIISQFAPGEDMHNPHDIAVTEDEREIYIVELDPYRVHRFLQDVNSTLPDQKTNSLLSENSMVSQSSHHEPAPLMDIDSSDSLSAGTTATTLILSLVTATVVLIAVCVAIAAIVAKCRKRGCLLAVRRRMHWEAERKENFKLSSFLESRKVRGFKFFNKRPNTRDFSKLNTEPETSEDERPENSLEKII